MGREWVARGHEVTVVTNFPNHPTGVVPEAYRGRSFQIEEVQGLRVVRCRTYATPNRGFVKRTLGHLVFMVQAVLQATPHLRGSDVLVASSPTLFAVVAALADLAPAAACRSCSRCATCGRRSSSTSA